MAFEHSPEHATARALHGLAEVLGVDAEVATGARRISSEDESDLYPIESAQIARASALRRREFASGRALLRLLLGENVPLPVGSDRRPVLPVGTCASIAHDRVLVVAALSRLPGISSLGVDLESASSLAAEEAALVLRPDEQGLDAALAFCLKEAAYKAWSGAGGRMLDHHDVRLTIDAGTFVAQIRDSTTELMGAWTSVEDSILALVVQHNHASRLGAEGHPSASA